MLENGSHYRASKLIPCIFCMYVKKLEVPVLLLSLIFCFSRCLRCRLSDRCSSLPLLPSFVSRANLSCIVAVIFSSLAFLYSSVYLIHTNEIFMVLRIITTHLMYIVNCSLFAIYICTFISHDCETLIKDKTIKPNNNRAKYNI